MASNKKIAWHIYTWPLALFAQGMQTCCCCCYCCCCCELLSLLGLASKIVGGLLLWLRILPALQCLLHFSRVFSSFFLGLRRTQQYAVLQGKGAEIGGLSGSLTMFCVETRTQSTARPNPDRALCPLAAPQAFCRPPSFCSSCRLSMLLLLQLLHL